MAINRNHILIGEAVNALILVWSPDTVRLIQHALREEIQEGGLPASQRRQLEEVDELLTLAEQRRWIEGEQAAKDGIKAYWEQGVPGTDNGNAKITPLKVVKNDSE
jgi:hypothetical protein